MIARLSGLLVSAGAVAALLTGCAASGPSVGAPAAPAPPPAAATQAPASPAPTAPAPTRAAPKPPASEGKSAAPLRAVDRCAANRARQKVVVSLRAQRAWMCSYRRTLYETAITSGRSGRWTSTPTGDYRIQGRSRESVLTLNTGAQYHVRYWIPFDAPLYGFHDSAWQRFPYGSAKYRTQGSHGCIHLPLSAMRFLYHWSASPTSVHIA